MYDRLLLYAADAVLCNRYGCALRGRAHWRTQPRKISQPIQKLLRSTIYTLVIVAAISVLVATLLLPVLQIYGTSMNPNLQEGDIVVSVKSPQFKTGDIIAFYYNNRVLVKRIIGCPGDSVVITDSGDVYVNNTLLDEPYLTENPMAPPTLNIRTPYLRIPFRPGRPPGKQRGLPVVSGGLRGKRRNHRQNHFQSVADQADRFRGLTSPGNTGRNLHEHGHSFAG